GFGARGVEMIHGWPFCRLRDQLLPLVDLAALLAAPPGDGAPGRITGRADGDATALDVVVLRANDRLFGLVVSGVNDTQDIVVKPLGAHLAEIPIFAGVMIAGDGTVVLILDVAGIAQCTRIVSVVTREARPKETGRPTARADDRVPLLLCGVGSDGRMAIPLGLVFRLEQFAAGSLEAVGDRLAVRHRDHVLPLLELAELLPPHRRASARRAPAPEGTVNVVIYSDGRRRVGLMVERIIDIVDEVLAIETVGARKGVIGSALIQGRVTEVVDVVR